MKTVKTTDNADIDALMVVPILAVTKTMAVIHHGGMSTGNIGKKTNH